MRRNVLSNLGDLDFDARELAKAAARRAGLSLEEWAAMVLAEQDGRPESLSIRTNRQADCNTAPSVAAERPRADHRPPDRDYEILMAAAAAESRRQAQDHSARTAVALESMASWIEHAEERLNETAQASADQQDRIASVLSQALSALKDRLDTLERHVASDHAAPARMAFPVQEAAKVLAPLSETLVGLRTDMSRFAERLGQPGQALTPALEKIRAEIERLRSSVGSLATREEVAALDHAMRGLAEDLEQGRSGKDLLTLAHAISALSQQVRTLAEDTAKDGHRRIAGEIEIIKRKIDKVAEAGADRSVIDFLGSQVLDMRQDLAHRAEPRQIAHLSEKVSALGEQIAELRSSQPGHDDFAALKASLESVCLAMSRTVAAQEASDVPDQLRSLSQRLDILVNRPQPEPASLDPIAEQMALMTEQMTHLSGSRLEQGDALAKLIDRLSSQFHAVSDKGLLQESLMRRFDRIEEELRQAGEKAEGEATSIAEQAARTALKNALSDLPDTGDLDALKQGFVEMRALQVRADKKTQQTLHAVHEALETLVSRFPERGLSPETLPSADRLEAAVRRLHSVALSQIEDVSAAISEAAPLSAPARQEADARAGTAPFSARKGDLGHVRANFIAAARRAMQTGVSEKALPTDAVPAEPEQSREENEGAAANASSFPPRSFVERLRRTFDSHGRPLLSGFAFLILAAGTTQILSGAYQASNPPPAPASASAQRQSRIDTDNPHEPAKGVAGASMPVQDAGLFQTSSLVTGAPPLSAEHPKFLVDPNTVGEIPAEVPAGLRQAALAGDAAAIYDIASRAYEGRGLVQDMALAARLYERAAQAGLPPAQERLAMLHDKGIGVARDSKLAATWYERAALGGNIRAMHNLATLLAAGVNGRPDYAAALRWYSEAAEAGLRDSQFNMGVLLARGVGAKQDLPKAFKWFSLAAAQGDADAAKKRDDVAARLTAPELSDARESLEQWHPRAADPLANEIAREPKGQTAALDHASGKRS